MLKWIITKRLIHSYENQRPFGRPMCEWKYNLKMDVKQNRLLGCELDPDNVKW